MRRTGGSLLGLLLLVGAGTACGQTGRIDIVRYTLHLTLPASGDAISADALVDFDRVGDELDTLVLDLVGMAVDTVGFSDPAMLDSVCASFRTPTSGRGGGSLCGMTIPPIPFEYDGRQLRIPIPKRTRPTRFDEPPWETVAIHYYGVPRDGLIIGTSAHGRRTFFADNWPQRARYWFPTVDDPNDKAEFTVMITASKPWRVIANGRPMFPEERARGMWWWWERRPIPTYTMVLGAAEFRVSAHRPVSSARSSIPIEVWTYPEDSAYADSVPFKYATEIVETLQRIIGPFPYEKLAHVESSTRYGGMENASAIFYPEKPYVDGTLREGVVRHETAHQWFGDAVTERDWHHLWLSEGFASYFDLVAGAALHGDSVLTAGIRANAESYMKSSVVDRPIIDPAEHDLMKLLNANNYQKGSWVLHMLRGEIGDSAFFRGLREYYRRYRDSTALSDDFERVMEQAAAKDLGWFFAQWLGQPGYPQLDAAWSYDSATHRLTLTLTQVQPAGWGTFRLPHVTIEYVENGVAARRDIAVDGRRTVDIVEMPAPPAELRVDPDGKLLLKTTVTRTNRKAGNP
jgi:aminopeptidase N